MIGIDLFSGAGGMSLGAERAGIDVKVAVESDPYAAETYRRNHRNTLVIEADVGTLVDLPIKCHSKDLIVFGGPPCQGFSTSNQRTRGPDNSQNWLFREFLRITARLNPHFVVFENVAGLLEQGRKVFFNGIVGGLKRQGYSITSGVLNAANFEVPQRRSRLFIVGTKSRRPIELPTHSARTVTSVRSAIHDLPVLRNGDHRDRLPYRTDATSQYQERMRRGQSECDGHLVTNNAPSIVARYKHIPAGGNWQSIPAFLMRNYADVDRCHTGVYRRLYWDAPSIVIGNFRKNMLVHPSQNRGLSVREAARLQSFPDSHTFFGSIGKQQQQVGNAVPPLLAQAVFQSLVAQV
ncbi:MAG: DNA cytosine methyltransferase [Enhydrobacter sp.]|nr:MAG: DNA cytosine methyltransferase [Enhydrobacter sp.]